MPRARLFALLPALLMAAALSGCADASDEPSEGSTQSPSEEPEGEERAENALFGVQVCDALLPALDGETEGLSDYADDEALAVIAGYGPRSDLNVTHESDGGMGCSISVSPAEDLLFDLIGDGHVGHRVERIWLGPPEGEPRLLYGSAEDSDNPESSDDAAIEAAVNKYRDSGSACGGEPVEEQFRTFDVYAVAGGQIVAVMCGHGAGGNTGFHELVTWKDDQLLLLDVEQWTGEKVERSSMVSGTLDVDGEGRLTAYHLACAGTCGTFSVWDYDGDRTLTLVEVREQSQEDPRDPEQPGTWDKAYPA